MIIDDFRLGERPPTKEFEGQQAALGQLPKTPDYNIRGRACRGKRAGAGWIPACAGTPAYNVQVQAKGKAKNFFGELG